MKQEGQNQKISRRDFTRESVLGQAEKYGSFLVLPSATAVTHTVPQVCVKPSKQDTKSFHKFS